MKILSDAAEAVFSKFRSEAGNLRQQVRTVHAELEKARRRREELVSLPLPPSDYADIIYGHVAKRAERYPEELEKNLRWLINSPAAEADSSSVAMQTFRCFLTPQHGHNAPQVAQVEQMLAFMFGEQIKAGLERAFKAMSYKAGPSRADRVVELPKLEARISELERQEAALQAEIRSLKEHLDA
jgi:hypothetical protein